MSIELKIKSKHLSIEPSIIRFEEKKLKKRLRNSIKNGGNESTERYQLENKLNSLINHRKGILREEARATYLAIAFISGKLYKTVENTRSKLWHREGPFQERVLKRVLAMVLKYGNDTSVKIEDIQNWVKL